jgi:hypothetical protein
MRSISQCLQSLPGFAGPKTYAPSPVWRGSLAEPVKFQPLPKDVAVRLWHDARRYERTTRQPGRQDGAIGRNGLAVLHALLFDFLNNATGRLDPAIASIARMANISPRSAARGLAALKAAGVLSWKRRCDRVIEGGRMLLKQISNAYAVLPVSHWFGYRPRTPAPVPERATWGSPAPFPTAIETAVTEAREGGSAEAQRRALESDQSEEVAAALASWWRTVEESEKRGNSGFIELPA